ncbi:MULTISPECIES: TetR/AcrR family transcriptional regulator [Mycolicibacterium]|uniref:Transcriptional regulator, TetR family protein n=2 Tax=Mycolicibacterium TaxID=1866885 RepID=A0A2U9PHN6_MYCSE|nr:MULTISPECIES: TetR/AcrR family transcriptional regulator [Mycolicibacterium]OKH64835.1 TetR family transcriptional regulator [Mycobacterium sp. SWH-M5]AWT51233.1 transcriptional regulator, TetR family protein [Mycolicibacterium smegmatis MKD8]MBU8810642.1 TetR/AcrR family transcriptional regulator [Mycolicibacterium goodii]MBU8818944.1 TetR/AcrR family transcriptional regulator [Mycolicibacterium goodii]MBU8822685.1 TetR/AcrR family transcriptional regulator [Mycolicibacterium goodii]
MAKSVAPRGFARERVLEAALKLFAEYGVHGTSLQMIADRLGVSKAAVYYQFHSKDEIVFAVVEPIFDDMRRLVKIAEAMSSPDARREAAVSGIVELAVRHRRVSAVFHGDPVIDNLVHTRDDLRGVVDRLKAILLGPDPDTSCRVMMSMLASGIFSSAMDPEIGDVPDEELHRVLLDCTQRLLRAHVSS